MARIQWIRMRWANNFHVLRIWSTITTYVCVCAKLIPYSNMYISHFQTKQEILHEPKVQKAIMLILAYYVFVIIEYIAAVVHSDASGATARLGTEAQRHCTEEKTR